ncbi:Putative ribonuclease H protein At1g65750, partial [Linum perenne]
SDGSVLGARGKATAGGILRQADGRCIYAYAINLGIFSITRAEIRGALEGIRRAWLEGYKRVEVQLDSQAAITILLDRNDTISHQDALEVFEFREWMGRDWVLKLKHVYREATGWPIIWQTMDTLFREDVTLFPFQTVMLFTTFAMIVWGFPNPY